MTDENNETEKVQVLAVSEGGKMLIADREGVKSIIPVKDGEPIDTAYDLYQMEPTNEPLVFSRTTIYKGTGPAKVTSHQYREGYDKVFGKKPRKEDMN